VVSTVPGAPPAQVQPVANRLALPLMAALSVIYWTVTVVFASRKLLWNDELYTFYMAQLPTMGDVWAALMSRGEQLPPMFYAITRASWRLFGVGNVSVRLPEIIGFWVMCLALYVFVSRRTSRLAGVVAATFPLVTQFYYYAFEARPYAIVLGCSAVALACWQAATEGNRRTVVIPGLAVALAGAMSTHYYAVFVVAALAAGEAVRSLERRRLDGPVWLALGLPALVLIPHVPLIRAAAAYSGAFWAPPQWVNVPDYYLNLLSPAVVPASVLALYAVSAASLSGRPRPFVAAARPPRHELAAVLAFVAIPVVCVVLAKTVTGAFVDRYAIAGVIGCAALVGLGTGMAAAHRPAFPLVAVVCLLSWFVLSSAREYIQPTGFSQPIRQSTVDRPDQWTADWRGSGLPVVIADPHTFVVLSRYSRPDFRSRLIYLADPGLALKYLGHNSVERGMLDLIGPWFGMHVGHYEAFLNDHEAFLVYGDFVRLGFLSWILPDLQARGMRTELLNRGGDNMLLLAYRGARPRPEPDAAGSAVDSRATGSHTPR
jgi:hypothetical protein